MKVKRICSWLLASAITVVFAATLITLALPAPAEAGAPWCYVYNNSPDPSIGDPTPDPGNTCISIGPGYHMKCSEARAYCRLGPKYEAYRDIGKTLVCGEGKCQGEI